MDQIENGRYRMFDCLAKQLEVNPDKGMLSAKVDIENDPAGKWEVLSVKDAAESVDDLAAGFLSLGISSCDGTPEGRDKIAIISKNRPEWLITDMAVQKIAAVLTPIYPTINLNELLF